MLLVFLQFHNQFIMKKHIVVCFFLVIFFSKNYGQGKIDKAEESLKKNERTEKTSSNKSSKSFYTSNITDFEGHFLTHLVGGLFIQLFAYTAYGIVIESPFEMAHKANKAVLTPYPYKNSNRGNYSYEWNDDSEIFTTTISNLFVFENNKVYGNHLNMDMRFLKRIGLELDYLQLWEENPNFGNNALAIYTVLAKYNRVRTEKFNAWWGLGTAYIDGDIDQLGFTYALGAELFFIKPFSIESNFNQTFINGNAINKFNALLNYHKKHYEVSLGYENLKLGDISFSNFATGFGISF